MVVVIDMTLARLVSLMLLHVTRLLTLSEGRWQLRIQDSTEYES